MSSSVKWNERAIRDLEDISEFTKLSFGDTQARAVLANIRTRVERTLHRFPGAGKHRAEFGHGSSFPAPPFVVFYKAIQNRPVILRVIHGYRDIKPPLMSLLVA